jgi:putative membrane protein
LFAGAQLNNVGQVNAHPADQEAASAEQRTSLAVERTQLAWWRTGLTALAVAIGIGRVVPELSDSDTTWPYALVGIAFAVYGIALFLEGTARGRAVQGAGERASPRGTSAGTALALAGPVLGLVVIAMIALAD